MMGIASNPDTIRESVSDMCTPPADRAEKLWLLLGLQWLIWCKLSQAESTSEFLVFPIMSEEVKELIGCTASGAGKAGVYMLSMVDRISPVFSIEHSESPPFLSRLVIFPE